MNFSYLRRFIFKNTKKIKPVFLIYEKFSCREELMEEEKSYIGYVSKPKDIVEREIKLHNNYWHCGRFVYDRYGLAYKQLSDEEIIDYVPTFYHHKKLEKDHAGIDTIKYSNKLIQAKLFKELNIPCADTIGVYTQNEWKTIDNRRIQDVKVIIDEYLTTPSDKLFIKPASGQGGAGIFVLKKNGSEYLLNGTSIQLLSLNGFLRGDIFLMQTGIKQSKQMMSINPSSVNTLRVIVQRTHDKMKMKSCSMRIGQNGSDIDNSCQGGLCIRVDTTTGQLDRYAKSRFDGYRYLAHPDTNTKFESIHLNSWNTLKNEIEELATKLVEFNNIALDIAVTEDGTRLIEFNFRYGIEHQQCGGVRRILNIDKF